LRVSVQVGQQEAIQTRALIEIDEENWRQSGLTFYESSKSPEAKPQQGKSASQQLQGSSSKTQAATGSALRTEIVAIPSLLPRSPFGDSIPRKLLLRASAAKPTSALVRF
jgi:hypothetical protein